MEDDRTTTHHIRPSSRGGGGRNNLVHLPKEWHERWHHMGARSYIVRGKGEPESFDSCAHGAGRRMSRTAAAKRFSAADLARQTEGVICRKDKGVVDEIPGAYKDIDTVMSNQSDLVDVMHTLKQLVCVKG